MKTTAQIQAAWKKILDPLREPLPMRPGSITQQSQKATRKDGSARIKGTYPLYTRKVKGKTVSRILREGEEPAYRQSVDNFHRLLGCVEQLKALGLELAEAGQTDGKKNSAI